MDEQDPRLTGERISGRGADEAIGFDPSTAERRGTTRISPSATGGSTSSPTAAEYASPLSGADDERRTREIRADIEQTREELSETVTAIQDRLRPSNVAATAADAVRSAASEKAGEMADSEPVQYMRANPIPSAMIGIGIAGLAWLAFGGREPRMSARQYGYRRTRGAQAWQREERGYYSPGDYAEQREEYPFDTADRARQATMRAQSAFTRTWNESPLLIGTAAMVAGAIVGLSVPETEREHRLMGDARDNMIGNVQRAVGEKVSQVQEAAADAAGLVQEAAKNAVGLTEDNTSGR